MGNFPLQETCPTSGSLSTTPARLGFPGGTSDKESACQRRRRKRRGLNSWVGKIPWRRAWRPTPVSWPGESPWAGYVHGVGKSRTRLKRLGRHTPTRFTLCGCTTSVWAAGPPPPPETALSSPHPGSGGPGHLPPNHSLWALQAAQCLEPRCQATSQTSSLVLRSPSHNSQEEKGPSQPGLLTTEDVSLAPSAMAQDQKWGEIKRK